MTKEAKNHDKVDDMAFIYLFTMTPLQLSVSRAPGEMASISNLKHGSSNVTNTYSLSNLSLALEAVSCSRAMYSINVTARVYLFFLYYLFDVFLQKKKKKRSCQLHRTYCIISIIITLL